MIGDTSNYLALAVKPIDVATPLLQAAKIRQSQMESQQAEMTMKKEAAGQFARGVMVHANSPDFADRWAEGMDQLHASGMIDPQSYARMRDNPNPLMARSIIAQTESPQIAFGREQLAESTRHNKASESQSAATLAETRRQHDEANNKPVSVAPGSNLVEPKTGKVVFQGSSVMSEGAKEMTARQVINGDLSGLTNLGKGAQGNEILTSIKNKAAEILMTENGMSATEAAAHLGTKLQAFKASSVGQTTEARTTASREANLNLILKATEAAIPAALEASDAVERYAGKFVPLNKIIQKGEVMTSDANLRKFGMANLQLAEHWARAMNPTGVMRESDRDMALNFLSTADSKDTYKQVVNQLKLQITRERDAVRSNAPGHSSAAPAGGAAAPVPGAAAAAGAAPAPPPGFVLTPAR